MIEEELTPLYAQKQARRMVADLNHLGEPVHFLLITSVFPPAECVWKDPSFGFFQLCGNEDKGLFAIQDLPKGTMIANQRYVQKPTVTKM